jgi:hypothetical protein
LPADEADFQTLMAADLKIRVNPCCTCIGVIRVLLLPADDAGFQTLIIADLKSV